MTLTRMFLVAFVLTLLVGCGKGKKESEIQQPASQPQPIEQRSNADALFDEFFDGSSSKSQASKQIEKKSIKHDITFSPNGRFVVQVSTIASSTLADEIAKKLEKKGFPAYVVSVENPTTQLIGTYYRVRIGGFDSSADAKYFGENMLRPLGYDFWVDTRSNDRVGAGAPATSNYSQSTNYNNYTNYPQAVDYGKTSDYVAPATNYPKAVDYSTVKEEDWAPSETKPEIKPAPAQSANEDTSWGSFAW